MNSDTKLTRALIEAGGIETMVARDAPDLRLLTEAERAGSLAAILAGKPPGDVWLFGYGSLIWNPTVCCIEQRTARIEGWHRAFCLSIRAGRGTAENPGLVLALDAGGFCTGVAFRIAEKDAEGELALLWRREMLSGAYVPRWIGMVGEDGVTFGSAIAFTINPVGDHYAGNLAREVLIQRLATAAGALGSAAEYLFNTRDGLRANGIPDSDLELLAASVEAVQALTSPGTDGRAPGERGEC